MATFILFLFLLPVFSAGDGTDECSFCLQNTCRPSLTGIPEDKFNPMDDCKKLNAAMEGLGTKDDVLVNILTSRSDAQRKAIVNECVKLKGSLVSHLKKDTIKGFQNILVAMVTPLVSYYTKELILAIDEKDRPVITEILSSLPPCVIKQVAIKYQELRESRDLHDDLHDMTIADVVRLSNSAYIQLIQSLAQGDRDESTEVNKEEAAKDAMRLKVAGVDRPGSDDNTFIEIFTKRSMPHLTETLKQYIELRKADRKFVSLEQDIIDEFSESFRVAFQTIARNALDQPLYFAEEIEGLLSIKGWFRTRDEHKLIRIMRARGDIDMEDIKEAYQRKYNKSLAARFQSAFYRNTPFYRVLLAIVNGGINDNNNN